MMNAITPNNREVTVQIVHGFVDGGAGGNPAGIVLDADGLNEAQMLSIASRVGLSETAFVSKWLNRPERAQMGVMRNIRGTHE